MFQKEPKIKLLSGSVYPMIKLKAHGLVFVSLCKWEKYFTPHQDSRRLCRLEHKSSYKNKI